MFGIRRMVCSRTIWSCVRTSHSVPESTLTSQEMSIALRPFYFAVHPDLFWQHPNEKVVNENSLKHLNSYLESLQKKHRPSATTLRFYVRFTGDDTAESQHKALRTVNVTLNSPDLHSTVHKLLSTCELSTDFLDKLKPSSNASRKKSPSPETDSSSVFWKRNQDMNIERMSEKLREVKDVNLREWLSSNMQKARMRDKACQDTRKEVVRLSHVLMSLLDLEDLIWDCGWGVSQFRGCLNSFYGLAHHYPLEMEVLRGRTLVFGNQTGVSLDGHIILSSGDVKHWWIDLLRSVPKYDVLIKQLPIGERELSEVLRGIHVDHRKFQPTVMVHNYVSQLRKLTSALYKYRWQNGIPDSWPRRMDQYQLVVECEAGPLMLSPTGQFIVPASCPAFLLVSFISDNLQQAQERIQQYDSEKLEESNVYERCVNIFHLQSLHKDDNVTPGLMIQCCMRLLNDPQRWADLLRGSHLRISTFYSVLQDGEICIPWNWKDNKRVN